MWRFRWRPDEDFRREIDAHLAIETERLIAEGLSPDDARHWAVRAFGNVTKTREMFYESRRLVWFDELRQDLRYVVRTLRRSPGFAAVATLTLAIGIGANTAIFSVVNAVLLRPLPYRDAGSLLMVSTGDGGASPAWVVPAWRDRATSLAGLAGFDGPTAATLFNGGLSEQIHAAGVTWNLLSLLGVAPALGRDFTAADAADGASPVVIVSDALWRRLGGNADLIGQSVTLSRTPVTIVGVTGRDFRFPAGAALPAYGVPRDMQPDVLRIVPDPREIDGAGSMSVVARLGAGVTHASAIEELLAIYRREGASEFSREQLDRFQVRITPLHERLVGNLPTRLWIVMGGVALVLLVACANVANLMLARASARGREFKVRSALGARRGRLARLLLTESVLIALIGSAGALVFAWATRGLARLLLADRVSHIGEIGIDWFVMAFNVVLAVATGVLCGLASLPAARRVNLVSAFTEDGAALAVAGRSLMRRLLLSIEAAVTFVLVIAAALLAQTLFNLTFQDNGFDPDRLLTARVAPGLPPDIARSARLPGTDRRASSAYFAGFFDDLQQRLQRIPGVTSVAAISLPPLAGTGARLSRVTVEGRPAPAGETFAPVAFVTPGYFRTMRIPMITGRDFDGNDRVGGALVAIVNETFQRRFAPTGSILGARVTSASGFEVFTIVGVTRDVPDRSLREAPEPLLVAPLAQMPAVHIGWSVVTFALRTAEDDPLRLAPAVRREIWAIDPNIVISDVATMDERLAVGMRAERDSALLFGLFALAALVMAAVGVYGVAAYAIAQRTREIGIRVALGAARRDVTRLVISQTLSPTLAGIAIGIAAAAMLTRFLASLVYGVAPHDRATFAVAGVVLAGVALAATWAPVRRAVRIDPLTALRYE